MQDRKFNLAIACFPYGGNGGISNEYPGVRNFLIEVMKKAIKDPRIAEINHCDLCDTPITMTRNQAVKNARQLGADFLLMIDSDMLPDCELKEGDPEAKPFWDTSWEFVMKHYDKGPNVVCAPYCGPPPVENVYAFYWANNESDCPNDKGRIVQYTREEAARMVGIQPCAAQPTGLILFDMRAFDLTDPLKFYNELHCQGRSREEAMALTHSWFYYEYGDIYQTEKCSTEDVTATRDISFHGWLEYGRDCIFINWDAWAGHVKPKVVRKPRPVDSMAMHAQYRHAVERKQTSSEKFVMVGEEQQVRHVMEEQQLEIPRGFPVNINRFQDGIKRVGMYTHPDDTKALTELASRVDPELAVEVGSWVGESSVAICKGLSLYSKLICVDYFKGSPGDGTSGLATEHGPESVKEAFLQNTQYYREKGMLELWHMDDSEARRKIVVKQNSISDVMSPFPKIDFLYLDAEHTYEFLKDQIENWMKCMAPDGVMAGHDFSAAFPGVEQAVRECFGKFRHIDGTEIWYAHVKDALKPNMNGKVCEPVA